MKRLFTAVLCLLLLAGGAARADDGVIRVLVAGTDRVGYQTVSEDETMSRADAILIVAFRPGEEGIRVLSVERDYLVDLPDGIGPNKLNTATYFGGPQMLLDAVNGLFGTDVRHYVQVDIFAAAGIIDSMGGVDVMVFEGELPIVNSSPIIEPKAFAGLNHFDGKKAQAFMRVRDMQGDAIAANSDRGSRQMRVLTALLQKLPSMQASGLMDAAGAVSPLLVTNVSVYDLLLMARAALAGGLSMPQLTFGRTPMGAYETRRVNMHQVVVPADTQEENRLVREFLLYP
ncbi:MAG TPA: LCP family protein [Candidatus Limnocylindria bacterium]|nr:LCP family protein [Candidatus Limnocylindria bacterium]